jgi:predicted nucleic acid-binding protein
MASDEACLLDTNILLRISKNDDPYHAAISRALHVLAGQKLRLCYTSQTLGEFWNASTRPFDRNGFGLSVAETDRLARVIERDFDLLPDSRDVHDRWRALLVAHDIIRSAGP